MLFILIILYIQTLLSKSFSLIFYVKVVSDEILAKQFQWEFFCFYCFNSTPDGAITLNSPTSKDWSLNSNSSFVEIAHYFSSAAISMNELFNRTLVDII